MNVQENSGWNRQRARIVLRLEATGLLDYPQFALLAWLVWRRSGIASALRFIDRCADDRRRVLS